MTNGTSGFSSKQELRSSSEKLLALADDIQEYRIAKLSTLTGPQLNSLIASESEVRNKAMTLSFNAIEGIVKSKLEPATNQLKTSISQIKEALDNLKEIAQIIKALTEILDFTNQVFKILISAGIAL